MGNGPATRLECYDAFNDGANTPLLDAASLTPTTRMDQSTIFAVSGRCGTG
jgi:hypothetical protein